MRPPRQVLEGDVRPARSCRSAPASIDMLQIVMRASIDNVPRSRTRRTHRMAAAPKAPMRAMSASTMSLEARPGEGARTPTRAACVTSTATASASPARAPLPRHRCRRRAAPKAPWWTCANRRTPRESPAACALPGRSRARCPAGRPWRRTTRSVSAPAWRATSQPVAECGMRDGSRPRAVCSGRGWRTPRRDGHLGPEATQRLEGVEAAVVQQVAVDVEIACRKPVRRAACELQPLS